MPKDLIHLYRQFYGGMFHRALDAGPRALSASRPAPWTSGIGTVPQYTSNQYLDAFEKVGWLYAVVDRISSAVAEIKWHLYEKVNPEGPSTQVRQEIHNVPAIDLLNQPNPFETRYEHFELTQDYNELTGECFWVILKQGKDPVELWTINPTQMEIVPSRDAFISGYVYINGTERLPLDPADVIHFKRTNPRNRYRGLSPVAPIMVDVDSQRFTSLWNRNFFRNSAEPGGVIEIDRELDEGEFQRLQLQWNEDHRGVAAAHRVALLEGGMKWVERRITQRDMQFRDLRKENRDVILANYGMPLHVLGIAENVNRANAEASEYVFARWVVRPRLARLRDKLNFEYLPLFDPKGKWELDFDDPVPENEEFKLNKAKTCYASGFMTKMEARHLAGLEPDENPDVYFVPVTGAEVPVDPKIRAQQAAAAQAAAAQQQPGGKPGQSPAPVPAPPPKAPVGPVKPGVSSLAGGKRQSATSTSQQNSAQTTQTGTSTGAPAAGNLNQYEESSKSWAPWAQYLVNKYDHAHDNHGRFATTGGEGPSSHSEGTLGEHSGMTYTPDNSRAGSSQSGINRRGGRSGGHGTDSGSFAPSKFDDSHIIKQSEVARFQENSAWKGGTTYHNTDLEGWDSLMKMGPDVSHQELAGMFGRGMYSYNTPGLNRGTMHPMTVPVAVRMKNPLVVNGMLPAIREIQRIRTELGYDIHHMREALLHAGHDGVIVHQRQSDSTDISTTVVAFSSDNIKVVLPG